MTPSCILPSLVLSLSVLSASSMFVSAMPITTTTHARERRSQVFGRVLAPDDIAPPVMAAGAAGPGEVVVVGAETFVIAVAEPHVEVRSCRLRIVTCCVE